MKNADVFLHSFHSILPLHHLPQGEINDWTVSAHLRSLEISGDASRDRTAALLKRFCVPESLINSRYYECSEVNQNWAEHEIYKLTEETPMGATIYERAKFFAEKSKRAFENFYKAGSIPSHLIHVTCTGYVSPSPAQVYFSDKSETPAITHAYHMGCYASLPAVRMAKASVLSEDKTTDIIHTEICSLHLNANEHTPEQMVVQTLFADGHIKYTASSALTGQGFLVRVVGEKLIPDSLEDMTWIPGAHGMRMTLSRDVPTKIQEGVKSFIEELCREAGIDPELVLRQGLFAIHPGGPRIIHAVQTVLDLTEEQVASSKKILLTRGNMSSATLPHVWEDILSRKPEAGRIVISLAFGPGLTMFGGVYEIAG